ncbi:PREDICTED: putative F-box protein At1g19160 [Ipomoea nil]|uniref:putative F-box protein At1g19160 n=1 Tax=Ipomoea nil TaxID=35883 RepID=UPI000901AA82|nr:PREDICTED: putative F-box protein At1g19160 [Ipomoea nil]
MEDCKLPMDTMIDILARLPVKTLMRFKCVCKYFYNLIKNNHQFMDNHYEFRKGKSHCAVIDFEPPQPNQVFNLIYKESECDDVVCIYLDLPNSNTRFVKCCHGMLCLILCRGDLVRSDIAAIISPEIIFDVLIFNPFTREVKTLPFIKVPKKPPNKERLHIQFGFGLSNNMTWKIIMLLSFKDSNWEIEDSHDIVMVCSQVGDLWSWRQIDVALDSLDLGFLYYTRDFYFKGKYYWQSLKGHLVWFDIDDEVLGKIERPSNAKNLDYYAVMNESIVVVTVPQPCTENEDCIEIWVMDENINNINWNKQTSIFSSSDILEYFAPIGFWNPSGHLLVFAGHMEIRYTNFFNTDYDDEELYFKDGFGPNLISIDLETDEKKTIFTSQEKKSTLTVGLNPAGHVQVCSERSDDQIQEWNDRNIVWSRGAYVRTFHESLKLL